MEDFIFRVPTEPQPILPQIIEENGLVYLQMSESGCISRIQTGVIIPEVLDESGEVISEKRIEPMPVDLTELIPTNSERIAVLEETQTKVVDTLALALGVVL